MFINVHLLILDESKLFIKTLGYNILFFRVTFAESCLAFVVYENDVCRGEIEKEENTQDAVSSPKEK